MNIELGRHLKAVVGRRRERLMLAGLGSAILGSIAFLLIVLSLNSCAPVSFFLVAFLIDFYSAAETYNCSIYPLHE